MSAFDRWANRAGFVYLNEDEPPPFDWGDTEENMTWLVERNHTYASELKCPRPNWTGDATRALRFNTKHEAIEFIRQIADDQLRGASVATQHGFIDGICRSCGGTGEVSHPEGGPQYTCRECQPIKL